MAAARGFSAVVFFAVVLLHSLWTSNAADAVAAEVSATDFIRSSCNRTRYPDVCYASLSGHAKALKNNDVERLAWTALYVSRGRAEEAFSSISGMRAGKAGDVRGAVAEALDDCASNFERAVERIRVSMKQMRKLRANKSISRDAFALEMGNVQSWMSTVLTDEDTCVTSFEEVVSDGPFKTVVTEKAEAAKKAASNALALMNLYVNSKR